MSSSRTPLLVAAVLALAGASWLPGQGAPTPVTRAAAVDSALRRGARLGVVRADSLAAAAELLVALAVPNPTFNGVYSKATPNYHITFDWPIDLPAVRQLRIRSARLGHAAARYRYAFARAAAALEADTTYTRTIAARELARLSRRNARDADSLRLIAAARRAVGDASDLDVELATVAAGQAANVADADSLTYISAVLDLQSVMGLTASGVVIAPSDSLTAPPAPVIPTGATDPVADTATEGGAQPLQLAAAEAALQSATVAARGQRRSVFASPSVMVGFETGDPTGSEPGILPTFGVAIPLPLLDRNRGPIAAAVAEQERARAELALARVTSRLEISRARRELAIALGKVERDRVIVGAAVRVARMSLTAYREGAWALANVLEAQRRTREVLAQYVTDLADAWIAAATLRVLTLTSDSSP